MSAMSSAASATSGYPRLLALKKDSGGRSYEYCLRYRSTAAFCHSGIGKMELNPPPLLILLPNSTAAARSGLNGSLPPVVPPTAVTWGMDAGNEGRNAHGASVAPHAKYGLGNLKRCSVDLVVAKRHSRRPDLYHP